MINKSTVTPKNSILCVGVNTDFFFFNSLETLVVEEGRLLCLWPLTFLRLYDLSATCRPSKLYLVCSGNTTLKLEF